MCACVYILTGKTSSAQSLYVVFLPAVFLLSSLSSRHINYTVVNCQGKLLLIDTLFIHTKGCLYVGRLCYPTLRIKVWKVCVIRQLGVCTRRRGYPLPYLTRSQLASVICICYQFQAIYYSFTSLREGTHNLGELYSRCLKNKNIKYEKLDF